MAHMPSANDTNDTKNVLFHFLMATSIVQSKYELV